MIRQRLFTRKSELFLPSLADGVDESLGTMLQDTVIFGLVLTPSSNDAESKATKVAQVTPLRRSNKTPSKVDKRLRGLITHYVMIR